MTAKNLQSTVSAPATHAVLEVLGGVHEGVTLRLDKTVCSIGSKPSADIVLGDSGVAPEHGVVRVSGSSVVVEAVGADISLGKRHRILQGHGCRTILPIELTMGTAVLKIGRPRTRGHRSIGRRFALRLAAVAGVSSVVLIAAPGFDTDAGTGQLSLTSLQSTSLQLTSAPGAPEFASASSIPSPRDAAATAAADSAPQPQDRTDARIAPEAVADALTAKLAEVGLMDIATKMDGTRIVASGAILPEQRGAWSAVQRWFDLTYGARHVLASTVETQSPSANPKFNLQAISFGDAPYVITADGQRRYPGAVLDKGWIIKEIGARRLTLTKDGKELALNF